MRITSGLYKGRILATPNGMDVRPASDKVRQAVFNSLLSRINLEGKQILDGFCGTGSYGLESLSRGAAFCTFIDKNSKSIGACRENITNLDLLGKSKIIQGDLLKIAAPEKNYIPADLLFLDPPYRQGLLHPALEHLKDQGWLKPNALCVLESERDLKLDYPDNKIYGEVKITYLNL